MSSFKTPPASRSTITRVAPPLFGEVSTLTPTLTWANSNPRRVLLRGAGQQGLWSSGRTPSSTVSTSTAEPAAAQQLRGTGGLPPRSGRVLLLAGAAADSGRRRPAAVEQNQRVPDAIGIGRRVDEHWVRRGSDGPLLALVKYGELFVSGRGGLSRYVISSVVF